jgi:enoyl-CoA hydratase
MNYQNIIYDVADQIATVTLNRPAQMNALSAALLEEYVHALKSAERDDNVRVVIVKAAGEHFCAGYDVAASDEDYSKGMSEDYVPFVDDKLNLDFLWGATETAWHLTKPVIAQVHGYCMAGGNDIAGQCDIVIAADDAVIQQPQSRRLGLSFNHIYAYKCGPQWAKILLLTGDPVSGREAEQLGIAAMAFPREELEDAVIKLARRLALLDPTMGAMNKLAVNRAYESMGLPQARESAKALDTIAHVAPVMQKFVATAAESGLRTALRENEAPYREVERPFKVPGI